MLPDIGDCDIRSERKILFMNEMKRYEIQLRPKGGAQKIFQALLPNFGNGLNKSCLKVHQFSWHGQK
jgi:hypothetical protein